jgi:hypothetical protein
MTFTYRGQTYTSSNRTQLPKPQTTYTYRGQSYERSNRITTTPQDKLIYRGVPYTSSEVDATSLFLAWEII